MKRYTSYLVGGILILVLLAMVINFDRVLLGVMHTVDAYGEKTNTETVGIIDGLNEIYYMFYE